MKKLIVITLILIMSFLLIGCEKTTISNNKQDIRSTELEKETTTSNVFNNPTIIASNEEKYSVPVKEPDTSTQYNGAYATTIEISE